MSDYTPEKGATPGVHLTHGVIRSTHQDRANSVSQAIARRIDPHGTGSLSCHWDDVLLPRGAPDTLVERLALVQRYEGQLIPGQADLLGITTVRFEPHLPAYEQWELARGWARSALVRDHGLAVVLIQHLPGLAGRPHRPHCHALWPVRVLQGAYFGPFTPLAQPGAKAVLAASWKAWLDAEAGEKRP